MFKHSYSNVFYSYVMCFFTTMIKFDVEILLYGFTDVST